MQNIDKCYKCDNNFAYKYDLYTSNPTIENQNKYIEDIKIYNFVPTYDKWCLYCNKRSNVKYRCSKCHSVYFCSKECLQKSWNIHKNHCGRNLFLICAFCGKDIEKTYEKCNQCPVKFCSQDCKDTMYDTHKTYDCGYFSKTFKENL